MTAQELINALMHPSVDSGAPVYLHINGQNVAFESVRLGELMLKDDEVVPVILADPEMVWVGNERRRKLVKARDGHGEH